jgi:hypothetical protein
MVIHLSRGDFFDSTQTSSHHGNRRAICVDHAEWHGTVAYGAHRRNRL